MSKQVKIRIDKFLWAVRIYKTRSIATNECRRGRIIINGIPVKPSHVIAGNEIITVKKPPVSYTYKVLVPVQNRISASLVNGFIEDLTAEAEKDKINYSKSAVFGFRQKGSGRPTKKERRRIDWLNDNTAGN
jgi:ribosome-associated heat shock protein Hsp15